MVTAAPAAVLVNAYDASTVSDGDTSWTDSAGSNNATFQNGVADVTANDPSPIALNRAVIFTGGTFELSLTSFQPANADASIEAWFRPELDASGDALSGNIYETGAGNGLGLSLGSTTNGETTIRGAISSGGVTEVTTTFDFEPGQDFVQVVLTVDDTALSLYVNGQLAATTPGVSGDWTGTDSAGIGGSRGGGGGGIDVNDNF
ncbi:MAG: LamG-like jellyroll fold domain-containing protein [Planctomycetota bacterium]